VRSTAFRSAASPEQRADPSDQIGQKREQIAEQAAEGVRSQGGGRAGAGRGDRSGLREGSRQDDDEGKREG
jgi:hypothetical protein